MLSLEIRKKFAIICYDGYMKIVILDDSMTVRLIIESLLEDLGVKQEDIVSFESGYDALIYAKEHKVDILFTDINMPQMSGYEFLSHLIEYKLFDAMTTFVISGEEDRAYVARMKRLGAKQFIRKPIQSHYFNHHLRPFIQKYQTKPKTILPKATSSDVS